MSVKPEAVIYTDGSCLGNPGPGGWASIVIVGGTTQEMSGGDPSTTNNRMGAAGRYQWSEISTWPPHREDFLRLQIHHGRFQ